MVAVVERKKKEKKTEFESEVQARLRVMIGREWYMKRGIEEQDRHGFLFLREDW